MRGWVVASVLALTVPALGVAPAAKAQTSSSGAGASASPRVLSLIDEDPLPSTRARGMGGAIGPVADDLDAAFHNPAGIGGLGLKVPSDAPLVRKLYFPTATAEANSHTPQLLGTLRTAGAEQNSSIGKAVVDAHAGEPQYARANAAFGLVLGRTMVVPFSDLQVAATPRSDGSGLLDTHSRTMTGVGYGLSLQSPGGGLSLGYFGYTANRSDIIGALSYSDMALAAKRDSAIKADTQSYHGSGNNVGAVWRLSAPWEPAFGLNLKNAGNTTFHGSGDPLVVKQDAQLSASVSPHLSKYAVINVVAEGDELNQHSLAAKQKYHLGTELLLGQGSGSYAVFGLRAGYTAAGASGGLSLHLGLIGLDLSSYPLDLSLPGEHLIERRSSATAFVNVAEF